MHLVSAAGYFDQDIICQAIRSNGFCMGFLRRGRFKSSKVQEFEGLRVCLYPVSCILYPCIPASCIYVSNKRYQTTMKYAELQVTTNFSFLRGASHPEEMVEQAAALGYDAIAIT